MRCRSRLLRTGTSDRRQGILATVTLTIMLAMAAALATVPGAAYAQSASPSPTPTPTPTPSPTPTPTPTSVDSTRATGSAIANLGSGFLERLGNQASHGFGNTLRNNPGGGGASEATDTPLRFRTWGEAYGNSTNDNAQGVFVGDHPLRLQPATSRFATIRAGVTRTTEAGAADVDRAVDVVGTLRG